MPVARDSSCGSAAYNKGQESVLTRTFERIYVDGNWTAPTTTDTVDVFNPTTEEVVATVSACDSTDADRAVRAARAAFDEWSTTAPEIRSELLGRVADRLAERKHEIAELITEELGMPLQQSLEIQAAMPIANARFYADLAGSYAFEQEPVANSRIFREPVGVVACITPWNYPLHQVVIKVAAALAAGCTVVLKPSELAPSPAFVLAEIIHEAGLPPGVFNLISGYGPVAGEPLVTHPDVDMVSFTGSTRAGTHIAALAAAEIKKISLELGGKSANLILRGADLQRAVRDGMAKCFSNSGQGCTALARMLVPRELLGEVERIAAAALDDFVVGDPTVPGTVLGPLVSAAQKDRVVGFIEGALQDGARLVGQGSEPPIRGFFVAPTVLSDVTPDMRIAREEVFGPVLALLTYDDESDGIRLANDTDYGLAGGVWAATSEAAAAVARKIRAGQVEVNGGDWNGAAPFGGFKKSGLGREGGRWGFEEFLELKAIQL